MFVRRGTEFGKAGSWGWAWRRRKLCCVPERVSWEHEALHFLGGQRKKEPLKQLLFLQHFLLLHFPVLVEVYSAHRVPTFDC